MSDGSINQGGIMTRHLRSQPETLRDYAEVIAGMLAIWWRQRRRPAAATTTAPIIDTDQGDE